MNTFVTGKFEKPVRKEMSKHTRPTPYMLLPVTGVRGVTVFRNAKSLNKKVYPGKPHDTSKHVRRARFDAPAAGAYHHRIGRQCTVNACGESTHVCDLLLLLSRRRDLGGVSNVRCRADRSGRRTPVPITELENLIKIESSPARFPLCHPPPPH